MPRQRRRRKTQVNLVSLIQRNRHHPYLMRPRTAIPAFTSIGGIAIAGGIRAIWNKFVQPISILSKLPARRQIRDPFRLPANAAKHNTDNDASSRTSSSQTVEKSPERVIAQKAEMPNCIPQSNGNTECICRQDEKPSFHDAFNAVILHRNPLFDAEGNTRSGLLYSKTNTDKDNITLENAPASCSPIKKSLRKPDSDSDRSSDSLEGMRTRSNTASGDSSEKSKSDTEESHSFDENVDMLEKETECRSNSGQEMKIDVAHHVEQENENNTSLQPSQLQLKNIELITPSLSPHTDLHKNVEKINANTSSAITTTILERAMESGDKKTDITSSYLSAA